MQLLEKEEKSTERLAHIIGRLERDLEDAVIDMFDGDGAETRGAAASAAVEPLSSGASSPVSETKSEGVAGGRKTKADKDQPVLQEVQLKMVQWLNSLPGLKKELVFIHPVRNSHAVIISRDVKRFPGHKEGEGVLRHWADHFIM